MSKKYFKNLKYSILILALLHSANAFAVTDPEPDPSVVVLFGDSIAVGYNLEEGFTERFGSGKTMIQLPASRPLVETDGLLNGAEEKRTSIVVNWGVGGSSSANGVSRISSSLSTTRNQYAGGNYYVLILYGTNDIGQGLTSSDTAFNVRQMIDKTRALGSNFIPVVANLLPRSDRDVSAQNSRIVSVVADANTPLVRLFEAFVSYPDYYTRLLGEETSSHTGKRIRLHPNVTGYQVIAQTWFAEALAGLIEPDPLPKPISIAGVLMLLLSDDEYLTE
ncbi:MAG: lysophospholipase L1-like esterase [Cryomorphaceae bacterium]|jgi:lysophospholipase L1-like esterase